MIRLPGLSLQIDKFRAVPCGQQILVCSLGRVAAVMEPVNMDIRRELAFHLAGARVVPREHATAGVARDIAGPHQTVGHQQVFQRQVAAGLLLLLPQLAAVLDRPPGDFAVVGGQQNDIVVNQHSRARVCLDGDCCRRWFGLPQPFAVLTVQADQLLAIMKDDVRASDGQRTRRDRGFGLPQTLAGIDLESEDLP